MVFCYIFRHHSYRTINGAGRHWLAPSVLILGWHYLSLGEFRLKAFCLDKVLEFAVEVLEAAINRFRELDLLV